MRVLVAGATGYLGRRMVRELSARGHHVRALARSHERLAAIRDQVAETVVADATSRASLAGSCDGIEVVISAVGIVGSSRSTVWDVDFGANRNLLDEAAAAEVRKFVYTSVLRAPGMEGLQMVRAKRAFEQVLRDSGMDFTVLYPNGYFSDMDEFLAMARRGRAFGFGDGSFRINPVDGADVAACAADAVNADEQQIWIGGPDVMTHDEIAREAFRALGKPARITHIPVWVARVALFLLPRLTPLRVHGPVEFVIAVLSRDLIAPTTGRHHLVDHFRRTVVGQE